MTLSGGKRKVNKSLKAWVAFVKKVQREEKLSYKDAIHRAKQRKDKGEKWMTGGEGTDAMEETPTSGMYGGKRKHKRGGAELEEEDVISGPGFVEEVKEKEEEERVPPVFEGGRRKTRRMSRGRSRGKGRTARRGRGRASRRY